MLRHPNTINHPSLPRKLIALTPRHLATSHINTYFPWNTKKVETNQYITCDNKWKKKRKPWPAVISLPPSFLSSSSALLSRSSLSAAVDMLSLPLSPPCLLHGALLPLTLDSFWPFPSGERMKPSVLLLSACFFLLFHLQGESGVHLCILMFYMTLWIIAHVFSSCQLKIGLLLVQIIQIYVAYSHFFLIHICSLLWT